MQDQLDDYCRSKHPTAPFARFDVGNDQERLAQWRCFSGDALDFNALGECVASDGTCTECEGDRLGTQGEAYSEDAMLKKLIKTVTGRDASCRITVQHRLDHWCAQVARLPYARHTAADGETVWTCAAGSDLDLAETARNCVNDAGSCSQCRGALLSDSVSSKYDKTLRVSCGL